MIDPTLLGEPAWEILLFAFIATAKGGGCHVGELVEKLGMPDEIAQRWVGILEQRDMLTVQDNLFVLSPMSETVMRALLSNRAMSLAGGDRGIPPHMSPQ